MDKLEQELASELARIPGGGGGDVGAYGIRRNAEQAAKIIREMIEKAVADSAARRQL